MKKAGKTPVAKDTSKAALKAANTEIKRLKADIKSLEANFKKELDAKVSAAYEHATEAAFIEFENREIAREKVIEKAIDEALKKFDKDEAKKAAGKKKKAGAKKKAGKKKAGRKPKSSDMSAAE